MRNPRVEWFKRVVTAVPLIALCLAVNSASSSDPSSAPQGTAWLTPIAGAEVAGAALGAPATDEPASVSDAARASASQVGAQPVSVGNGAIPDAALRAYQRAEVIIAESDKTCGLQWELLAAIGRIESDHGRFGGSTLNKAGKAVPAIKGLPLNGKRGTLMIKDTDAGILDGDKRHDRAVGPMQFIPSTWSVVGVDADGDGRRDPQDIDDAALAAAVHLCGGTEDLTTDAGLRAAVLRYNRSSSYVDQVIALQEKYLAGKYNATPTSVPAASTPDLSGTPSDTSDDPHSDAATDKPDSDGPDSDRPKSDRPKADSGAPNRATDGVNPKQRKDGVDNKPRDDSKPDDPFDGVPPADPEDCVPDEDESGDPVQGDEETETEPAPTDETVDPDEEGDPDEAADPDEEGEPEETCPVDPEDDDDPDDSDEDPKPEEQKPAASTRR